VDAVLHGDRTTQLKLVFSIFDRDGGGSIDRGELGAVVADALHAERLEARPEAVAALVEAVFRDFDRAQDGRLSFEEFEAWLGHEPQARMPACVRACAGCVR
jgi:Ca2+-binding EF-hand superfamily protein